MNCNCCNCSNNNSMSCEDEKSSKIKIYGTLVNVTLDPKLKDDRDEQHDPCKANNWPNDISEEGHNGAIAYAYQLHDGRFRQDDENMAEWERFQDEINKRVTDIVYDETGGGVEDKPITIIENPYTHDDEGNLVPIGDCDCDPYDDTWLKGVIGATPDNHDSRENELNAVDLYPNGGNTPVHKNNIIDFILNLAAEVNDLRARVIALEEGGSANTCYWKVDSDNYLSPNNTAIGATCQGVRGPGFYDTTVS